MTKPRVKPKTRYQTVHPCDYCGGYNVWASVEVNMNNPEMTRTDSNDIYCDDCGEYVSASAIDVPLAEAKQIAKATTNQRSSSSYDE